MSWVIIYNSPSIDGGCCVYQPGFPECQVTDKEPSNFSACSPTFVTYLCYKHMGLTYSHWVKESNCGQFLFLLLQNLWYLLLFCKTPVLEVLWLHLKLRKVKCLLILTISENKVKIINQNIDVIFVNIKLKLFVFWGVLVWRTGIC